MRLGGLIDVRFLHDTSSEISAFCAENKYHVFVVPNKSGTPPTIGKLHAIEDLLHQSQKLWGTSAPFYFVARKSQLLPDDRTLADAVVSVETMAWGDDFLLIAYQDGGLISVSGRRFTFQESAKPAPWWHPVD
jgi:hypothetical protein